MTSISITGMPCAKAGPPETAMAASTASERQRRTVGDCECETGLLRRLRKASARFAMGRKADLSNLQGSAKGWCCFSRGLSHAAARLHPHAAVGNGAVGTCGGIAGCRIHGGCRRAAGQSGRRDEQRHCLFHYVLSCKHCFLFWDRLDSQIRFPDCGAIVMLYVRRFPPILARFEGAGTR